MYSKDGQGESAWKSLLAVRDTYCAQELLCMREIRHNYDSKTYIHKNK